MTLKLGALASVAADVSKPARMEVINVDTEKPLTDADGQPCWIDFYSADSEAGRKLDRERSAAAVRKFRSGRNRVDDGEDPVDVQVETLSALAAGWYFGPDAEEFSASAARKLFADPAFAWLRKQAYVFVNAEANFIKSSSKT
jgi:hypothetical protein